MVLQCCISVAHCANHLGNGSDLAFAFVVRFCGSNLDGVRHFLDRNSRYERRKIENASVYSVFRR